MMTFRFVMIRLGLGFARWFGWRPPVCARPHLPADDHLAIAAAVVQQVAEKLKDAPGAIKAREAQRMLTNIHSTITPREANLLIELALAALPTATET